VNVMLRQICHTKRATQRADFTELYHGHQWELSIKRVGMMSVMGIMCHS